MLKLLSYFADGGVYVPHFENLSPVLVQQDCVAVQHFIHTTKTKVDGQAELLQFANIREDIRSGLWDSVDTRTDQSAANMMTKAVSGPELKLGVAWNAQGRPWRPIDRERAEFKASRCRKCAAKWLVHAYCPRRQCMVGTCQNADCGAQTPS